MLHSLYIREHSRPRSRATFLCGGSTNVLHSERIARALLVQGMDEELSRHFPLQSSVTEVELWTERAGAVGEQHVQRDVLLARWTWEDFVGDIVAHVLGGFLHRPITVETPDEMLVDLRRALPATRVELQFDAQREKRCVVHIEGVAKPVEMEVRW